ncbi:MAG: ABC transporter substrate-binding protein, partial [Clostridia bacterium]|nr:ABC transporter substrate-binding protein [Clostridia bacterium]
YMVQKGGEAIESMEDLRGKTIYATSKGTVTEYNLRYLLTQYGINPDTDVTIEWKSEPAEVVATLKTAESGIAMLPQPYVSVAQTNIPELQVALDLTEEWDHLQNGSAMITGTLVVRKAYAEENPQKIAKFLKEYEQSTSYVKANVEEAAAWVETYVGIKAPIAKKAIPYCNITFIAGQDMKAPLEAYLEILYSINPQAVGGKLPDDAFYYVGN